MMLSSTSLASRSIRAVASSALRTTSQGVCAMLSGATPRLLKDGCHVLDNLYRRVQAGYSHLMHATTDDKPKLWRQKPRKCQMFTRYSQFAVIYETTIT